MKGTSHRPNIALYIASYNAKLQILSLSNYLFLREFFSGKRTQTTTCRLVSYSLQTHSTSFCLAFLPSSIPEREKKKKHLFLFPHQSMYLSLYGISLMQFRREGWRGTGAERFGISSWKCRCRGMPVMLFWVSTEEPLPPSAFAWRQCPCPINRLMLSLFSLAPSPDAPITTVLEVLFLFLYPLPFMSSGSFCFFFFEWF